MGCSAGEKLGCVRERGGTLVGQNEGGSFLSVIVEAISRVAESGGFKVSFCAVREREKVRELTLWFSTRTFR